MTTEKTGEKVTGLVLRAVDYGENDRIMTILTQNRGRMTVRGRGVKNLKSKNHAACEIMCYAEFVLNRRGGIEWVSESNIVESFFGLREDLNAYTLGTYVLELAEQVSTEEENDDGLLQLSLNTLYALGCGKYDFRIIKAAHELRLLADAGFCPELDGCGKCGNEDGEMFLDISGGILRCSECADPYRIDRLGNRASSKQYIYLENDVISAMKYIVSCPVRRLFSFTLSEECINKLSVVCERFAICQLERTFHSLEFYHSLENLG